MGGGRDGERRHNRMGDGRRRRWNAREKKEHLSVQSAARAFREIFCSKRNVEPEQRINIQGKSTAKDPA